MQRLLDAVTQKTVPERTGEMQKAIAQMVCNESQPIPLEPDALSDALEKEGEFLLLQMSYDDFAKEPEERKIARKLREATAIVASFEDDGSSVDAIEEMLKYIHDRLDELQSFRFGIKRVERLSDAPVSILFAGILPINQLRLKVGEEVMRMLETHRDYYAPLFRSLRHELSEETGVPILPLEPRPDPDSPPRTVQLEDPYTGQVICEFEVAPLIAKEGLEIYLVKLYYVYKRLIQQMRENHQSGTE